MEKDKIITPIEFMSIISGTIIGVGILTLPSDISKYAHEDGWISILIGLLYPLYLWMIMIYVSNKKPNNHILELSRKYFGNMLGNIFNLILALNFLYSGSIIVSYVGYVLINYLSYFLSRNNIIILISIVSYYTIIKGFKVVSRLNYVVFFVTIILLLIPSAALKRGSFLNVLPVFKNNIIDVMKGTYFGMFSFIGMEVAFLIYPFISDKKQIKKYSIFAFLFVALCYIWVQFITLFYLGDEVAYKLRWPLVMITETLNIPLVNNFRYIFIFLWTNVILKTLVNYCFFSSFTFQDVFKFKNDKVSYAISIIILIIVSISYKNLIRTQYINMLVGTFVIIYNLIYITTISIFVKRDDIYEK
ncbi:GerAB/ArcD/ProY family transporter [uncultured Clostridium sp.]|uniref:GerAB/ArcD/ProY family transporter n=1 Tax=uncultured Clostridium sp. TaxID=59620 RepID=UPI0028ED49C5|nr:GerAB/ArcD/ProY family transporter [uncultured Clostridium sp.]